MTTIGNDLTVDGTITASQATQAGEAVVLGDDGMIPANLVASGGGKVETPYFYVDDGYTYFESLTPASSVTNMYEYSIKQGNTFGVNYNDGTYIYSSTILPKYGAVATNFCIDAIRSSSKADFYKHTLDISKTQLLLNEHIRTNLRGNFILRIMSTRIGSAYNSGGSTSNVYVTISDDGITVTSGNFTGYYSTAITAGNVYLRVRNIMVASLPEWC